jgi:hypothetical protein
MSAEKPWEDYADPLAASVVPGAPAMAAAAAPPVGYGEDIVKGAAGGLGRGFAGLAGLPGDIPEYGARGLDWATRKVGGVLGSDIAPRQAQEPSYGSAAAKRTLEGVTGPLYEPKTIPGQYASTIGEFAPGALIPGSAAARVANTVIPALTSETAGQITKDTAAEPWARAIGGLVGAPLTAKLITPAAPATAAHQAAVATLEREGIPLTAGQRTGSRPIQWAESVAADMPGSGTAARNLYGKGKDAYDRAFTEELYDRKELTARGVPPDVNLPDAQVARAGPKSLSDEYTRITQNDLVANPQLLTRMGKAQSEYERLVLPSERATKVADTYNDIIDKLVAGQGRMKGDEYQSIRSQLGTASKAATNPKEAAALREMKHSLDEAFGSSVGPRDAAALALNNQRYGNMKQTQDAVAAANTGNLSPARMAQAVRAGRGGQYSAQTGNLDELTRAAAMVMKDLPNSGTGPRTGMQTLFNVPNALAAGGAAAGSPFGLAGAAIGAAAPFAASRAVVSGLGQKYLGNRALPQNTRDVLAQTLLQQAISQDRKDPLRITVHPRR